MMTAARPRLRDPARLILAEVVAVAPILTSAEREKGEMVPELSCHRLSPEPPPVPHAQADVAEFQARTSVSAHEVRRERPEELMMPPVALSWIFEPVMEAVAEMSSSLMEAFSILAELTAPSSISVFFT